MYGKLKFYRLQPITEELTKRSNMSEEARLDVAARGFWQRGEMAFFDVRVFNPFAKSHQNKKLKAIFDTQEKEKKRAYNQRVIQVEHGSFSPMVFSCYGGYGRETERALNRMIERLSDKRQANMSDITNYVRTKISYTLLKSAVTYMFKGNEKKERDTKCQL